MKPANSIRKQYIQVVAAVIVMIILAGLLGWQVGNRSDSTDKQGKTAPDASEAASEGDIGRLVSYTAPDGWTDYECPGGVNFMPSGTEVAKCDSTQAAPISLSVDPQNTTDCSQLDNVQGVQKHTCRSVFVDGRKSLQAETVSGGTTTAAHYIDTGQGVVKLAYAYTGNNEYQSQYDQLLSSIDVKN